MRPFTQLHFEAVPAMPRVPHPFAQWTPQTVRVAVGARTLHLTTRTRGSGPDLLLVHGFMTSSYSFRYVLETLERAFRVTVVDLPGCGDSDRPDMSYSAPALAEVLLAFLRTTGLHGARAIGNSLGGYLLLHLLALDRGALSRLINLHSPGVPTKRLWALRAATRTLPGWRVIVDRLIARDPERWVHRNVHYWDESLKSREEHDEYARPLRTPEGRHAFLRMLSEALDPVAMEDLARALRHRPLETPIQLVYARRDPMVPPRVGPALHALLPSSELVWLDEASHFAHVDAPARFLEVAVPFLQRES